MVHDPFLELYPEAWLHAAKTVEAFCIDVARRRLEETKMNQTAGESDQIFSPLCAN